MLFPIVTCNAESLVAAAVSALANVAVAEVLIAVLTLSVGPSPVNLVTSSDSIPATLRSVAV